MTAITATFSDFRFVRGRKVAQLIFEVPLEGANAALAALGGVPMPDKEVWVGIAPLNGKAVREPPRAADKPRRKFEELPLSQQAGIIANEPAFWRYAQERLRTSISGEEKAAEYIRKHCSVSSRADIRPGTIAETSWIKLRDSYEAWKVAG